VTPNIVCYPVSLLCRASCDCTLYDRNQPGSLRNLAWHVRRQPGLYLYHHSEPATTINTTGTNGIWPLTIIMAPRVRSSCLSRYPPPSPSLSSPRTEDAVADCSMLKEQLCKTLDDWHAAFTCISYCRSTTRSGMILSTVSLTCLCSAAASN